MQRGMVTVELAFAALFALAGLVFAWWMACGFLVYDACQLSGYEVARQVARGDDEAAQVAMSQAPSGARVSVSRSAGNAVVTVEHVYQPVAWVSVPIVTRSTVMVEP